MRIVRTLAAGSAVGNRQTWIAGLHIIAALAAGMAFGPRACLAGLAVASLACFVVFMPLTALTLNGGRPIRSDDEVPALTLPARLTLFGLWTLTAWSAAALIALVG